ncbi:MAG: multiheme c-type cytochrome [Ferruginibacter sp.]
MRYFKKYRSSTTALLLIVLCGFIFTKCINNEVDEAGVAATANFKAFAGSASCISCHKTVYDSHINTAHFHTSETANAKSIKGSFDSLKNLFVYSNGGIVQMEKRADSFYQVAYINGIEKKRQRFDMVIGSGTKGQSYASWAGNKLLQMPITYFTSEHQWSNSPGYPNKIAFNRPITSRCLECHATFAEKISAPEKELEEFDKRRMILGVDCERCHGPASAHVAFHAANPTEKKAKFMANLASFTRQQSLDMCALCHGGRLQKTKSSFQFTAGDKLPDYFLIDTAGRDVNSIDVHGNQFGMLAASKCFKLSATLTCNTCHNPHENEKGKAAIFAARCSTCHNDKHAGNILCKITATVSKEVLNENCVNCHMPEQPSMAIAVILQGQTSPTPALMHTHLIKNYPNETKKILAYIKEKSTN